MSIQSDAKPLNSPSETQYLSPSYEIKHEEKITVIDKNVELFVERTDLLQGTFEYPRRCSDPGLVLIFNQEYFEHLTNRPGSRRDVNEIIICMSRLGYNINEKNIFNNLTRDEILKKVKEIVAEDLSNYNCLIVYFLTHGDSYNQLHASDMTISAQDIWNEFAKCSDLKNKPKMFILQACKGDSHSKIADHTTEEIALVSPQTFVSGFFGPDMLVVYSTTEGNVSFRDTRTGSWFIQELCKNFNAYGRRDDVLSLVMRTTKCICRNYYHYDDDKLKKQSPIFISTLRRKFYLNTSKDRNIIFRILGNQEKIERRVDDLEKKVDELVREKIKRPK